MREPACKVPVPPIVKGGWRRCRLDEQSEREFLEFVAARTHVLFRMAYALTGHQQSAEDLLQSALATCALRWRQINGHPEPYVRKVMYHEQVSWWRRRRRYTELSMAQVPDRMVAHDPSHDAALKLTLHRALARLGARQRAVLVLRYLEDLSEGEVARIMGCSESTVGSQASRALARLRQLAPELRELLTAEEVTG
jgi:RNA polymerase sigma-70 factor (sigma-E family)